MVGWETSAQKGVGGVKMLGRSVLNLAANTNHTTASGPGIDPSEVNNLYRAAFQVLWLRTLKEHAAPHLQQDKVAVGKIAAKCSSFVEYVRKGQKRLDIPSETLTDEEIELCFRECCAKIPVYRRLTALRALVARSVESLVLIDRLAFLLEGPDIAWAGILPMFDPRISPRSFAMVASRA